MTNRQVHAVNSRSPLGLTWHNGAIPSDEPWVKGRGINLNMQLVNSTKPNSMKRTTLTSVFKAGDSTTNLHIALDMYREHVVEAQGMQIQYEQTQN